MGRIGTMGSMGEIGWITVVGLTVVTASINVTGVSNEVGDTGPTAVIGVKLVIGTGDDNVKIVVGVIGIGVNWVIGRIVLMQSGYSACTPPMSSAVSARLVKFDETVGNITAPLTLECARPRMWPISCSATVSMSKPPATAPMTQVCSVSSK